MAIFIACSHQLNSVETPQTYALRLNLALALVLIKSHYPLTYRIAGFFKDKNFHELTFPRFLRGEFSRIVRSAR